MVKGLVVPADRELPIEVLEFQKLEDYQSVVGGWIEAVDVPPLGITMYVNEEGLLRDLPFNSRATFLWWYEVPVVRNQAMLVGDAVVVGLPDADGESTSVPESTLALLTRKEPHAVLARAGDSPLWRRHVFPHNDFIDAVVWAMMLAAPVTDTREVRVVTLDQLHDADMKEAADRKKQGDGS